MSLCPCSPEALTSLAFADGTVLVRCGVHEQQQWCVDGRPAPRDAALSGLAALFTEHRGRRGPGKASRTAEAAPPAPRPDVVVHLDAPDSDQLTALLQSRGLPGTWAVA